jgi:hypothetical protein
MHWSSRKKSAGIIVVTEEVVKGADAPARALFESELQKAVVAATDSVFLNDLVAATTSTPSAGATLANITTDLDTLLTAITIGATSRIYFVTSPANMKGLSVKANTIGAPAFPEVGPLGGELLPGVTAIASDQVGSGVAIMVAADAIAGSSDTVVLDGSSNALLQMETAPDSPPTATTVPLSLWQHDMRALRAERWFGFTVHRTSGVASLSGVNY